MEKYKNVDADFDTYKQYVGEALFFRAYFNFILLKNYGEYPYVDKVLFEDSEELLAPRTPRNTIAQNIIDDLEEAMGYMTAGKNQNGHRLNKGIAQLFQARVALYEGTWEKYHAGTPFGVSGSNGSVFLTQAQEASNDLMNSGVYSISDSGNINNNDYQKLFNQTDYASNSEIMLWKQFDAALGLAHNGQRYLSSSGGRQGITKSLVDDYLCTDGLPASVSPLYQGDENLNNVSSNRDPRLVQTIWLPGDPFTIDGGNVTATFTLPFLDFTGESICPTGYQIKKGANPDLKFKDAAIKGTTSSPVFRYAEALLIYAEAKAELGTLTQADLNKTINVLRDRVDMPHLLIGGIATDPNWLYPDLSPMINEIRREVRVEFAAEGYRNDDLYRWAAHKYVTVGKTPLGAKFQQADFPDLVIGERVFVNGDGYVNPLQSELPTGYQFDINRDYLLPVPPDQIVLNPSLTQNPGWTN